MSDPSSSLPRAAQVMCETDGHDTEHRPHPLFEYRCACGGRWYLGPYVVIREMEARISALLTTLQSREQALGQPGNLPDAALLAFWRSVQGPHAGLTGPLIRFAGLVYREALAREQAQDPEQKEP